jgi:hypothetical protein
VENLTKYPCTPLSCQYLLGFSDGPDGPDLFEYHKISDPTAAGHELTFYFSACQKDFFGSPENKEKLLRKELPKHAPKLSDLTGIIATLSPEVLDFLHRQIDQGGIFKSSDLTPSDQNIVKTLRAKNLCFSVCQGEVPYLAIPLELCFAYCEIFRFDSPSSLVQLAYRHYSVSFMRYAVNCIHNKRLSAKNKMETAVAGVGWMLTHLRKNCLRQLENNFALFMLLLHRNSPISYWELRTGVGQKDDQVDSYIFFEVLREPGISWRRERTSPFQESLLRLIAEGIVGLIYPYHFGEPSFVLSQEARVILRQPLAEMMEAKQNHLIKEMATSEPPEFVSFTSQVLHDIERLQVAVACGMVEYTKTMDLKIQSAKAISQCMDLCPSYLGGIFNALLANTLPSPQEQDLEDGELEVASRSLALSPALALPPEEKLNLTPYSLLSNFSGKAKPWFPFLAALSKTTGWIKKSTCMQLFALIFHPHNTPFMEEKYLDGFCFDLHCLGFLEADNSISVMRATPLLQQLVGEAEGSGNCLKTAYSDLLSQSDRPIIVQPNFELLLPIRCERKLFGEVGKFAEVTKIDQMVTFQLTSESIVGAGEKGVTPRAILLFLQNHAKAEIPSAVSTLLASLEKRMGEAMVHGIGCAVKCANHTVKAKIIGLKEFDILEGDFDSDTLLIKNQWPHEVVKILKKNKILAASAVEEGVEQDIRQRLRYYQEKKSPVTLTFKENSRRENVVSSAVVTKVDKNNVEFKKDNSDYEICRINISNIQSVTHERNIAT